MFGVYLFVQGRLFLMVQHEEQYYCFCDRFTHPRHGLYTPTAFYLLTDRQYRKYTHSNGLANNRCDCRVVQSAHVPTADQPFDCHVIDFIANDVTTPTNDVTAGRHLTSLEAKRREIAIELVRRPHASPGGGATGGGARPGGVTDSVEDVACKRRKMVTQPLGHAMNGG